MVYKRSCAASGPLFGDHWGKTSLQDSWSRYRSHPNLSKSVIIVGNSILEGCKFRLAIYYSLFRTPYFSTAMDALFQMLWCWVGWLPLPPRGKKHNALFVWWLSPPVGRLAGPKLAVDERGWRRSPPRPNPKQLKCPWPMLMCRSNSAAVVVSASFSHSFSLFSINSAQQQQKQFPFFPVCSPSCASHNNEIQSTI